MYENREILSKMYKRCINSSILRVKRWFINSVMTETLLSTLLEWSPSSVTTDGEFTSVWSLKCICSLIFKVPSGSNTMRRSVEIVHRYKDLCCSVPRSCPALWPHGLQHTRLPCATLSSGICSNSCLLSQWCHPTISSSIIRL